MKEFNNKDTSSQSLNPIMPPPITAGAQSDLNKYDVYYQGEFSRIIESGEKYRGKWNWFAFLFGPLWCLYKGCWAYGLLVFALNLIVLLLSGSAISFLTGLAWSVILGLRGTWIVYNVKIKQIQFPKSLF